MSKQQEAPGDLEIIRAFVNTIDIEGEIEELTSPAALGDWLQTHGLATPPLEVRMADLQRALELREAIRAVLRAHTGGAEPSARAAGVLDAAAQRARIALRFDERGQAQLEPQASGVAGGLGRLLMIIQNAIADGTWSRLKACRDHACEWAFYDHTKNRSGTWCTMDVCGNRAKARSYRGRRADGIRQS